MSKLFASAFLFFTIFLIRASFCFESKKIECFMHHYSNLITISSKSANNMLNLAKEKNLYDNRKFEEIPRTELFGMEDFKIQQKIEKLLINFDKLPSSLKSIIEMCFPSSDKTYKTCLQRYPKEGCQIFNEYVSVKNCPLNQENDDLIYCFPKCSSDFQSLSDDKFSCRKQYGYSLVEEENLKTSTDAKTLQNKKCLSGYRLIGDFLCIQTCPTGWIDMGDKCEKPMFKRRDGEVIYYRTDMTEKEE